MKTKLYLAGKIGLLQDDNGVDLPQDAWNRGQNIRFKDGYAEKHAGTLAMQTPSVAPYAVFHHYSTAAYHVYTGLEKIYAATGTSHTEITRASGVYTGTAAAKWTSTPFAGFMILTNGIDLVQSWTGATAADCIDMTNWPAATYCKVIRAVKNYLVALNITETTTNYKSMVRWSHPADPGSLPSSWDYTDTTKRAGRVEGALTQTDDAIVDAQLQGDDLIIYKETSGYVMRWVGGNSVFAIQRLTNVPGILATNCVANTSKGHVLLTNGDVVLHSSGQVESIIDERNRRVLFATIDGTNYGNSFVIDNPWKSEVWVCYPTSGATYPDQALVWNYKENTWGVRDLPDVNGGSTGRLAYQVGAYIDDDTETIDEDGSAIDQYEYSQNTPRLIFASSTNTKIYLADHGKTESGTAFTSYVERTGMDLGTDYRKLVKHVWPKIDGEQGVVVDVYVGVAEEVNESVTWHGPYSHTIGTTLKIDCMAAGRYIGIKFQTTTGVSWRLKQYQIEYELLGQF